MSPWESRAPLTGGRHRAVQRSAEEGPYGAPFAFTGAVWFPGSRPRGGGDWKAVCLIPITLLGG